MKQTILHNNYTEIAYIFSTHSIHGQVKIKIISQDLHNQINTLALFAKTANNAYEKIDLSNIRKTKKHLICTINNVNSIDDAQKFLKTVIYCKSIDISLKKDEFLVQDLLGKIVYNENYTRIGEIININNFGASDIIEIATDNKKTISLPFLKKIFTYVNIAENKVIVTNNQYLLYETQS